MKFTPTSGPNPTGVEPSLIAVRADNPSELDWNNPGRLLERYRQYLLLVANELIGSPLRSKLGASDLVQETFLHAHRQIDTFRGRTSSEMRAWLHTILERRLANIRRSYQATEKRAAEREVALETVLSPFDGNHGGLAGRILSPSDHAVQSELALTLGRALDRLPEHYRQAFAWRHHDQLSWDEIGRRMGSSADAARKVWSRAIHQLRAELGDYGIAP
jgi:RNA polymerase sigma-70 factor, ECF subfamily